MKLHRLYVVQYWRHYLLLIIVDALRDSAAAALDADVILFFMEPMSRQYMMEVL